LLSVSHQFRKSVHSGNEERLESNDAKKFLNQAFILCFAAGGSKVKKHYANKETLSEYQYSSFIATIAEQIDLKC